MSALKVFITGASSGIGSALAKQYAAQGATLGLLARRKDQLEALQAELNCPCSVYAVDVRDANAIQLAAQDFMQRYGTPDIVIANAGVSAGTLTQNQQDNKTFEAILAINVLGIMSTFQPFIEPMKQQQSGQLVGIASIAGVRGLPGAGAYCASKAAAIAYLESLRVELADQHIAVTTIAPGYIKTAMTDVNQHHMPFLMDVDVAAAKFVQAIAAKRRFIIIPWQMGILAKFMRLIPDFLWDFSLRHAPRKAHANWDWL
jgi:short-subunit dehydrogenase